MRTTFVVAAANQSGNKLPGVKVGNGKLLEARGKADDNTQLAKASHPLVESMGRVF